MEKNPIKVIFSGMFLFFDFVCLFSFENDRNLLLRDNFVLTNFTCLLLVESQDTKTEVSASHVAVNSRYILPLITYFIASPAVATSSTSTGILSNVLCLFT